MAANLYGGKISRMLGGMMNRGGRAKAEREKYRYYRVRRMDSFDNNEKGMIRDTLESEGVYSHVRAS